MADQADQTDQAEQAQPQFGANIWVVDEMYRRYVEDPDSVGDSWKEFFSDYRPGYEPAEPPTRQPAARGRAAAAPRPAQAKEADAPRVAAEPAAVGRQRPQPQPPDEPDRGDVVPLRGAQARIAQNMLHSLQVPTATSIRVVPAKLLEVNRRIANNHLARARGGKVSFTHIIGWAMVKALGRVPAMTASYREVDGRPHLRQPKQINLGLAIDVERGDGSRTLLVPNIKAADSLDFAGFFHAYEEVVRRVRRNDLDPELFADTTCTLTNPGTLGTVGSVPRLMAGQSMILGVGAIGHPAEYQATDPRVLAEIGVGKVITLTSTYDHRVIQGAESGLFLKTVHELLVGEHRFYEEVFDSLQVPYEPVRWRRDEHPGPGVDGGRADKVIAVDKVINMYRVRGHLIANLNPLAHTFQRVHPELDPATYGLTIWDLDREFPTGGLAGHGRMRLGDILGVLRDAYCRTVGVEYMHIAEPEQKAWIQQRVEGVGTELDVSEQRHILSRLNNAEAFERFLHTKYIGHKRFSTEGAESVIPMLDALLNAACDAGIHEAVLGMAHRGRLNVLANILHKGYDKIFKEFEGDIDPDSVQGSGDVKYHLGATGTHRTPSGGEITVTLSSNPSHLEAVDPVVEGMARAKLDQLETRDGPAPVLPVLLHGDAAFAGQGVVAETLAMSQLRGYRTGGTVHLVVNNQLGFTTPPQQGRSSTYPTDVAKMVQAPIFHVNGDDPEACVRVMRLAFDFRQAFAKDVVVDLVCYRRWGHNEADDPSLTQPLMYAAIEERRSVRKLYTEELVNRGDITLEEAEEALNDFREQLERALRDTRETAPPRSQQRARRPEIVGVLPPVETGVEQATLQRIVDRVTSWPDGFRVNPKLGRQLERRRDLLRRDTVDWAMAEALAFGSLLLEGVPVRLAGQDSRRGTFSQRHAVLVDYDTGREFSPLAELDTQQAPFMIYDSPLNEFAAMGFEYGYSVVRKEALVCWEAQFGDFANGAQPIIDQFVVAAEDKWGQTSGLVLLLPHGYEGQGPEHSSCRLERFLTLAAEDNIQIAQPTTAAQYFHLLRRQMHRDVRKPLVVATPKSLLRARTAASATSAFTSGVFLEVLDEDEPPPADQVRGVLLCSGKVAYDLVERRDRDRAPATVVRVEQLYPFPQERIGEALDRFPGAQAVVWVQDEPENMGPWPYVHGRLHRLLRDSRTLRHVSRVQSASPATGSAAIHAQEHEQLLDEAFADL
ncbi:MAG TPA: multifunctional oxoglutarate decarboxylase/oxoglutarate dehydrogenase thiamine pyrophosphate-binding subunit/dihydrolipoyllysine-residue succinyltransferase subunit [Egibacteraceae bacterium]|nr:multifunctional oxoglutarate decarboxylase/oxoglutarate dehydrogenase thiamine pyrophosphate-binding subunit/dihydrolipoyllysine-residue succinyltransferase subunit [Egibacteraceae bacterium]